MSRNGEHTYTHTHTHTHTQNLGVLMNWKWNKCVDSRQDFDWNKKEFAFFDKYNFIRIRTVEVNSNKFTIT